MQQPDKLMVIEVTRAIAKAMNLESVHMDVGVAVIEAVNSYKQSENIWEATSKMTSEDTKNPPKLDIYPTQNSSTGIGCVHNWLGGGSDKFRSVHCTKCGAAHPDNYSSKT